MWNRKDLKARGKIAFRANYWKSVLVGFLAMMLSASGSSAGSAEGTKQSTLNVGDNGMTTGQSLAVAGIVLGVVLVAVLVVVALDVFVMNPLKVGCNNFFLSNRTNPSTELDTLSHGFKADYKNVVKTMFMMKLYIFLWTLLLIVPGIIKGYEYRLVPYFLAEDPAMDYKEALDKSKQLMYGQKWNTFVLDLSFFGWIILGALTFGVLDLFYVNPYIQATDAELYVAIAHPEQAEKFDYTAEPSESKTVEFDVE